MDLNLTGKTALITGGSRGIGAAIATELAREGVHVCLVARDATRLRQVADSLASRTVRTAIHPADLREQDTAVQAVEAAIAAFGRLDILVNNAGATRRGDFFALTDADFLDGFALKFHAAVRMTRAAWPHLRQAKGCVINIAGVGAHAGAADFTIGGSVNAALLHFTKAMADIGIEHGVRVNAVSPGLIETERYNANVERLMRAQSLTREQAVAARLATHRTKRVGQPREVAALVAYLASDRADFIQGALIDIDGGATRAM